MIISFIMGGIVFRGNGYMGYLFHWTVATGEGVVVGSSLSIVVPRVVVPRLVFPEGVGLRGSCPNTIVVMLIGYRYKYLLHTYARCNCD